MRYQSSFIRLLCAVCLCLGIACDSQSSENNSSSKSLEFEFNVPELSTAEYAKEIRRISKKITTLCHHKSRGYLNTDSKKIGRCYTSDLEQVNNAGLWSNLLNELSVAIDQICWSFDTGKNPKIGRFVAAFSESDEKLIEYTRGEIDAIAASMADAMINIINSRAYNCYRCFPLLNTPKTIELLTRFDELIHARVRADLSHASPELVWLSTVNPIVKILKSLIRRH